MRHSVLVLHLDLLVVVDDVIVVGLVVELVPKITTLQRQWVLISLSFALLYRYIPVVVLDDNAIPHKLHCVCSVYTTADTGPRIGPSDSDKTSQSWPFICRLGCVGADTSAAVTIHNYVWPTSRHGTELRTGTPTRN